MHLFKSSTLAFTTTFCVFRVQASEFKEELITSGSEYELLKDHSALIDNGFLTPSLPVGKPIPTDNSLDSPFQMPELIDMNYLFRNIPDAFVVDDCSGSYPVSPEDSILTSSNLMTRRAFLYLLLAEIYKMLDSFDLSGFNEFILGNSYIIDHTPLRYHLIENILGRSSKTSNSSTHDLLGQFIGIIDQNSQTKSVGENERGLFKAFKERIKLYTRHQLSDSLDAFLKREKSRLNSLSKAFESGDYASAMESIQASNGKLFITFSDFKILLDGDCSQARFNFIALAISIGAFNVHERFGVQQLTPLMMAAGCSKCTNDIVKAILWKDPSSIEDLDLSDHSALYHAMNNKDLSKKYRKPLIQMLQLDLPTYSLLDAVVLTHDSKV